MDTMLASLDILAPEGIQEYIAQLPAALQVKSQMAWERFQALPMPTRKDERWRFADILDLTLDGYTRVQKPEADTVLAASDWISQPAAQWVHCDGHALQFDQKTNLQKQGIIFMPLAEAFEKHPELIKHYFFKESVALGSAKFQALHQAYAGQGTFIYIPRNVALEAPLVNYHWLASEGGAIFPHTLIVAESGSAASVVDIYASSQAHTRGLNIGVAHAYAGANASLMRTSIQAFNLNTQSFQIDAAFVERDARFHSVALHLGGHKARFENQAYMRGPGSEALLSSLTVAENSEQFDQRSLQVHQAPNAKSDLLYKNALLDEARTIFSGMIVVEPCAQKTDAYQTNRNLLLDTKAEAVSLPGLEIEANDVKCSHGATSSQLNSDELFYMQARGMPLPVAQELLVTGFFEEVIERIGHEELANHVRDHVRTKLLKNV